MNLNEPRIQHVITNVLIDHYGDRAKVRANLMVHFAHPADGDEPALAPPNRFTLGEVYHFDVARTPKGWRFRRVETIPVWMSGSAPPPARSN
jgi:SnoaL-like domain